MNHKQEVFCKILAAILFIFVLVFLVWFLSGCHSTNNYMTKKSDDVCTTKIFTNLAQPQQWHTEHI